MARRAYSPALAVLLVGLLASPLAAAGRQGPAPELWKAFAAKLPAGAAVTVRMANGERFKAALLVVTDEGITVQRKTRVPVPPQFVRFADMTSLEVDSRKGASVLRAVAVGAAVAAGAFFGLMALAFAVAGD